MDCLSLDLQSELGPKLKNVPCSSSQVIDISTETSPNAAGDEATNAEKVTAYISLFVDSVGGNGRQTTSNPSLANHDAMSILFKAGKCFDVINLLQCQETGKQ